MSEINVNLTVSTSDVLDKLLEKKPQNVQNFILDINDDMNNLDFTVGVTECLLEDILDSLKVQGKGTKAIETLKSQLIDEIVWQMEH